MKTFIEIVYTFVFIIFLFIFAAGLFIESYEIAGLGLAGVVAQCYIFKIFLDRP